MEECFTKLNDSYGPAAGTALRPFTTAPAAVGDRRMHHAQEDKEAARKKAADVIKNLHMMKLNGAAKKVEDGVEETLTYMSFPTEHWSKIRTNNVIERMNREIRRRTRVVGTFPDGNSALMLVCARLRHVTGTQWVGKKYMSMKHFETREESTAG